MNLKFAKLSLVLAQEFGVQGYNREKLGKGRGV